MKKGFTLIEMMVSVAIFAVVMTIALGALLAMSESDRKAQTIKSITNNLSFALDSMSRSIRTGDVYHCGDTIPLTTARDCSAVPDTYFTSYNADGKRVVYCLGSAEPPLPSCTSSGTAILVSVAGAPLSPITSPEVKISALSFYVTGADSAIQPKVTILISGFVTVSGTQTSPFNLQTSVTQRLYDQ